MTDPITRPTKTRELHNHHFDSTIWNDFAFRDDDIVIATSHNDCPRVQGHGSAVFFHLRRPDGGPTAGCVAVSLRDMRIILQHVGPRTRLSI